jgi:hypothetical protein
VITLDAALSTARQALATVTERSEQNGHYSGARTSIINSHAELRAALKMLVKAAEHATFKTPPTARLLLRADANQVHEWSFSGLNAAGHPYLGWMLP